MTLTAMTDLGRRAVRTTTPGLLLGLVAAVTWWAGPWLALPALVAVAAYRAPDPQRLQRVVELLAGALILALATVALLAACLRGDRR